MLANALMDRASLVGRRPVTLVGFSLGARVIFYCLKVRRAYLKMMMPIPL